MFLSDLRKKEAISRKTVVFVIGQICTPHVSLNSGFRVISYVSNCYDVNCSTFN